MPKLAYDPPVSDRQRRAMYAAAAGHSTLGIPRKVGKEFIGKDMEPSDFRSIVRGLLGLVKFMGEEEREPEHQAQDALPLAAGIALMDPEGRFLLLRRSGQGDHQGEWCWPGGHAEEGEDAQTAAKRELREETGHDFGGELGQPVDRSLGEADFHTFLGQVDKPFEPKLNDEHDRYVWAGLNALPEPLHPGVAATLGRDSLGKDREPVKRTAADMALDRSSVRSYDKDGRLHVDLTPISKANICEYFGREIPDSEKLGLDPNRRYKLLRHPEELAKGAATFNNLPLLSRHVPITADEHPKELVLGSTGTDAVFAEPYLKNSLVLWSRDGIDDVEADRKKELSSAYHYRADMTPGEYEGEPYDGVMRDIVGNHVALVKEGRAGSDVVVGDEATPKLKEQFVMAKVLSRFGAVAQGALMLYLRPKLAQDAKIDFGPILGDVSAKNFKAKRPEVMTRLREAVKGKLAKDANIEDADSVLGQVEEAPVMEGADTDENSGLPMSEEEMRKKREAKDAEPHARLLEFLKDKVPPEHMTEVHKILGVAKDEPPPFQGEPKTDMVSKHAMDAAIATAVKQAEEKAAARQKAIHDAEREVEPWVGKLAMAHDSAEGVYATALGALGVKEDFAGLPLKALQVMLRAQAKPGTKPVTKVDERPAMDEASAKSYADMFPSATRIGKLG